MTNGPESSARASSRTGIGPWMLSSQDLVNIFGPESCNRFHKIIQGTHQGGRAATRLLRRVLRRVLETAATRLLRRVLRRILVVGFRERKGSERGS